MEDLKILEEFEKKLKSSLSFIIEPKNTLNIERIDTETLKISLKTGEPKNLPKRVNLIRGIFGVSLNTIEKLNSHLEKLTSVALKYQFVADIIPEVEKKHSEPSDDLDALDRLEMFCEIIWNILNADGLKDFTFLRISSEEVSAGAKLENMQLINFSSNQGLPRKTVRFLEKIKCEYQKHKAMAKNTGFLQRTFHEAESDFSRLQFKPQDEEKESKLESHEKQDSKTSESKTRIPNDVIEFKSPNSSSKLEREIDFKFDSLESNNLESVSFLPEISDSKPKDLQNKNLISEKKKKLKVVLKKEKAAPNFGIQKKILSLESNLPFSSRVSKNIEFNENDYPAGKSSNAKFREDSSEMLMVLRYKQSPTKDFKNSEF